MSPNDLTDRICVVYGLGMDTTATTAKSGTVQVQCGTVEVSITGTRKNVIVMSVMTNQTWAVMSPDTARQLAVMLLDRADAIEDNEVTW